MKKIILILIVIAAVAGGCEKITLNKFYGDHTLKTISVDGEDYFSLYNDSLGTSFGFYYDDVSTYDNICVIEGPRKDGMDKTVAFNWELDNFNKKFLQIYSVGSIGIGPFGNGKNNVEWEILRLKKNSIMMKTNYNNRECIIELEKK